MVMGTGIISISAYLLGFRLLATPLLWLNIVFYAGLWILTCTRIISYPGRFFADLADHGQGVGFFTTIAATSILGTQFLLLRENLFLAKGLLFVGFGLWVVLIYGVFTGLIIKENKPSLDKGITGLWLVATVATQSVSVLSALLSPYFGEHQASVLFLSLFLFLVGCALYLMIITLIFYRFMFFLLTPAAFVPSYWINMGAVAITTLAGATLALESPHSYLLERLLPFLLGFTVFFWATATWWIPLLLVLQIWRHGFGRGTFAYDRQYWSMVFPLGMYTACTEQLARIQGMEFLSVVPKYFIYAAILAWLLTFIGLIRSMGRFLLPKGAS